jgi:hypothetical protein
MWSIKNIKNITNPVWDTTGIMILTVIFCSVISFPAFTEGWYMNPEKARVEYADGTVSLVNNATDESVSIMELTPRVDDAKNMFFIQVTRTDSIPWDWVRTIYFTFILPWQQEEDSGYFIRNVSKSRGTLPGTDTLDFVFSHDIVETSVEEFEIHRIQLAGYDYRNYINYLDTSIIEGRSESGRYIFTDKTTEFSNDRFHRVLGSSD